MAECKVALKSGLEPERPAHALVAFLQSDAARDALQALAARETGDSHSLPLIEELRRSFSPEEAGALLSQARLRKRAAAKWPFAAHLLLVEEALEQATAWPVALQRAARLQALAPDGPLLDLGSGIGGDLLALSAHRPVVGYESDPLRAALARANVAAVQGSQPGGWRPAEVRCADWSAELAAGGLPAAAAAFADPARRAPGRDGESRRRFSLAAMQPPIGALLPLLERLPLLAVKVAPGLSADEAPAGAAIEFVSHEGVCKEAVLWLGEAAATLPGRWASVHDGAAWHELAAGGEAAPALGADELPVAGQLLWEPDAAVMRAGALDTLCRLVAGRLFAPDIAYVIGGDGAADAAGASGAPFATPFRLLEIHPFSLRQLQRRLAALDAGPLEIKKRGFPVEPEELRGRLGKQRGSRALTVLLTRRGKAHWMLIAERLPAWKRSPDQEVA